MVEAWRRLGVEELDMKVEGVVKRRQVVDVM